MLIFAVGTFMLSGSGALAVDAAWTGNEDSDMNNIYNWSTTPHPALSTGTFAGDASATHNPELTSGLFYADGLAFQSAGWNLTGGGTLALGSGGLNAYQGATTINTGTINIYTSILTNAATQNWGIANTATNSAALNIYGSVSGDGNIAITGRAPVNLWADNSAFSGTLLVNNNGVLGINHANALGSNALFVYSGGVLTTSNSVTTVANDINAQGNLVYNMGLAAQSTGPDGTIASITDPRLNNNTLILAGNVNLSGVNTTFYIYSGTLVITGGLIGNGFTKGNYTGDGVLVLAGDNRGLTGKFTYSAPGASSGFASTPGFIAFNHEYALGSVTQVDFTSNAVRIDNTSGSAINLKTSTNIYLTYTLTFAGSNDLGLGDGMLTIGNPGNQTSIYVNDKTLSIGSLNNLREAGKAYYANKYGPGNLILSGTADLNQMYLTIREGLFAVRGETVYSGTISVNAGQYAGHGTITSGLLWGNSGGTSAGLAAYGGDLTVNLGGSGSTYNWGGGLFGGNQTLLLGNALSDGIVDIQNGVNLNSAGTRTVEVVSGSGATKIDARFSGSIIGTDNRANLTKTGGGVLEIAGNTNYAGWTTIVEGTLLVSGTANNQRPYTVNPGATLGGHGTIILSGADVNVSGVLDVSGGGVLDDLGTLTLNLGNGTLNLSAAEGLGFILGADGDSDQIKLLGNTKFLWNPALTLDDFSFTFGSGFTGDGTYELIVSEGTLLPSFTDLTGTLGGGAYDATLALLNSNALVLTVTNIPEPSTLLLMLSGAALLLTMRRWKNPK